MILRVLSNGVAQKQSIKEADMPSSSTGLEVIKMASSSTSMAHLNEATLLGEPQPVGETKVPSNYMEFNLQRSILLVF